MDYGSKILIQMAIKNLMIGPWAMPV